MVVKSFVIFYENYIILTWQMKDKLPFVLDQLQTTPCVNV